MCPLLSCCSLSPISLSLSLSLSKAQTHFLPRSTLVSHCPPLNFSAHARATSKQVRAQLVLFCQAGPSLLARSMTFAPAPFSFSCSTSQNVKNYYKRTLPTCSNCQGSRKCCVDRGSRARCGCGIAVVVDLLMCCAGVSISGRTCEGSPG